MVVHGAHGSTWVSKQLPFVMPHQRKISGIIKGSNEFCHVMAADVSSPEVLTLSSHPGQALWGFENLSSSWKTCPAFPDYREATQETLGCLCVSTEVETHHGISRGSLHKGGKPMWVPGWRQGTWRIPGVLCLHTRTHWSRPVRLSHLTQTCPWRSQGLP